MEISAKMISVTGRYSSQINNSPKTSTEDNKFGFFIRYNQVTLPEAKCSTNI